ncbi:GPI inositol-deacylase isoform X1 [Senna tora]|uniref:GPI inositol-deacylase n=1 Tax=Senna tora TaxID=362788 RepID=A0A834TCH5_9FABA|nr:GPI inositol-deacylase isoform X1 [Senna tora]
MLGFRAKASLAILIVVPIGFCLTALYFLLQPISNRCIMTYMYPTYIPIPSSESISRAKYELYLYREGWSKVNYEHLKMLDGVPVLFIPGNGGSYKQARVSYLFKPEVRSLAAESYRAYKNGPLERTFYQEASLSLQELGAVTNLSGFQLPNQYSSRLDWFTVDLKGEHSAMDGGILRENTEYVVYAIHKILDMYKVSYDARAREAAAVSGSSPKSVILVGHSMGGFVARAAVIHPRLRKSAVETVLTLSTPHQSPPLALQPSLVHYFAHVNREWREGYKVQTTNTGRYLLSDPVLSHVVVISISGTYNDYQHHTVEVQLVRTKETALDDIVPPTHGFMISSSAMKNVWLSMEHQAILWCNQLVVQVSHTLLSLIDSRTGQPFPDAQKRLSVFARMLRSGISHNFNGMMQTASSRKSTSTSVHNSKDVTGSQVDGSVACPFNIHWNDEGLESDLYIQTNVVTVLAMDGRRRWLDMQKLGSNGKSHFVIVTNIEPCSGVRFHLWPDKEKSTSWLALSGRVVEVTSKMMRIPSSPAHKKIHILLLVEPGDQTEQVPPSAVFWLGPDDMHGFRFLTISVATVSGGLPSPVSMAVGQFFNPEEAKKEFSPWLMFQSIFSPKEMLFKEAHPLAINLSFAVSLGLLPLTLSLKTANCGIRNSGISEEEALDHESSRPCKSRCFPPVALAWDNTSGLYVYPNFYSETIFVDSSPARWSSTQQSQKTIVLLLVDPHCSYRSSITISVSAAASRFLLLYNPKIIGFSIAIIFFALMRQAYASDFDLRIPSMLTAVESNLRVLSYFFPLAVLPIFMFFFLSLLTSQPFPPFASFISISLISYILANGFIAVFISISHLIFYVAAVTHMFIKTRWKMWERYGFFLFLNWFINLSSDFFSLKVVIILRTNSVLATALAAIILTCLVHPALDYLHPKAYAMSSIFSLPLSGSIAGGKTLRIVNFSCFLTVSCVSISQKKETLDHKSVDGNGSEQLKFKSNGSFDRTIPSEDNCSNSSDSSKSFGDTQLAIFHCHHGLFMLDLVAAMMFAPSFAANLLRIERVKSLPLLLDSILCVGVILHGFCYTKPKFSSSSSFNSVPTSQVRLYFLYLICGYWSYFCGLALAPYRALYVMAALGGISFALRMLHRTNRQKIKGNYGSQRRFHRD